MRVRYAHDVAKRSVDRAAWAAVVSDLIARETKGNKSRFAQVAGVSYKTIQRWLLQEVEVSEESVRQIADAMVIPALDLLLQAGYYQTGDLPSVPATAEAVDDDRALQVILSADVPDRVKRRMIQRLYQMRDQQIERQVDEVKFWIDQASEN
jgi:transcriptional regulator with XRE-family HTH domain